MRRLEAGGTPALPEIAERRARVTRPPFGVKQLVPGSGVPPAIARRVESLLRISPINSCCVLTSRGRGALHAPAGLAPTISGKMILFWWASGSY